MFITFEGIDGCGKTTQVKLLKSYFETKGFEVISVREPGSTKISEQIRSILLNSKNTDIGLESEALLFSSARAQIVKEVIIPSLNDKKIVICDRFIDSTLAYQGYGRGMDLKKLDVISSFAIKDNYPEYTFFIDISIEESKKRLNNASLDRMESAGNDFFTRVRNGFIELTKVNPNRIHLIDGKLSVRMIHSRIINIINRK
ncbi:MAG: dTMP kinase [Candidatus Marinimicrobia bacterium]|nr:dTMP kinase [Candidatus Neomarinimicrobiota bacterium]|tara:strand:+ start:216 stop:818 length:603 start_codon:yes stop_codon:yes gene_type:complete